MAKAINSQSLFTRNPPPLSATWRQTRFQSYQSQSTDPMPHRHDLLPHERESVPKSDFAGKTYDQSGDRRIRRASNTVQT
ncbi:hypothetical protein C2E31_18680 [Rhodopirellula baltica]|nr:hypothetical protein C2E31_18680 [Rhodopirellula baltica]